MRIVRQVTSYPAWGPLVLATAAAALAASVAARPAGSIVTRDGPHGVFDHRSSPRMLDQRSWAQGPESHTAGLSKRDDVAQPRGLATGSSIARGRKGGGSWLSVKSLLSRRVAEPYLALPGVALRTFSGQIQAVSPITWPLGRSTAESVVLLRRLRL